MKNYVTSTLHALKARRANSQEWSRLERVLTGPTNLAQVSDTEAVPDRYAAEENLQMLQYLALQTSQTV